MQTYEEFLAGLSLRQLDLLMLSALRMTSQTNDPTEIALRLEAQQGLRDKGLVTETTHRHELQGGVWYDVFAVEPESLVGAYLVRMQQERLAATPPETL